MVAENIQLNPLQAATVAAPPIATRPKRSWRRFFRDIFLYFTIYILVSGLTIGPFFWSWYGAVYVDGPKWIARFYLPLALLCEFCPPLRWLVNVWINWWIL